MAKELAMQAWVRSYGGTKRVAAALGVTDYAVRSWCRRRGWPKIEIMLRLICLSKGKLTLHDIVRSTCPPSKSRLVAAAAKAARDCGGVL